MIKDAVFAAVTHAGEITGENVPVAAEVSQRESAPEPVLAADLEVSPDDGPRLLRAAVVKTELVPGVLPP